MILDLRARPARSFVSTLFTLLALGALIAPAAALDDARVSYEELSAERARLVLDVETPRWQSFEGAWAPRVAGFGLDDAEGLPLLPIRHERLGLAPGQRLVLESLEVSWGEGLLPGPLARAPDSKSKETAPPFLSPAFGSDGGLVRVVSQRGALRGARFATLAIRPMQVDEAAGRYRLARRVVLTLRREGGQAPHARALAKSAGPGNAPFERLARRALLGARPAPLTSTAAELAPPRDAATTQSASDAESSGPTWQLRVDETAIHAISYAWAEANQAALGGFFEFLRDNDPRRFRMRAQGSEIPILIEGEADGVFGPGDVLYFFGERLGDVDPFRDDVFQDGDATDTNVYVLDLADGPQRADADPLFAPPTHAESATSFWDTARREDDTRFSNFIPDAGDDHWLVDPFLTFGNVEKLALELDTPDHVGGSVQVRVGLMGFDRPHQSQVLLDGALIDTQDWDGLVLFTHDVSVDRSGSPLGTKSNVEVAITNARGNDQLAVDWAEIDYERALAARSERLIFAIEPGADVQARLSGFSIEPLLFEISDAPLSAANVPLARPRLVEGLTEVGGAYAFDVDDQGATRRFVAATRAAALELEPSDVVEDTPTEACPGGSLRGADCGADWVVIGPRAFLSGPELASLVTRREGQGLTSALVALEDVRDEFTFGIADPEAVRLFLAHALTDEVAPWSPAPSYVVLLGDGSYDFKNNYGHAEPRDLLSTAMFDLPNDPQYKFYPSDTHLAAVVGDDDLADAFIGRIPAHSLAEAEVVFGKILDYEASAPSETWTGHALLVTEAPDDAGDALAQEFRRVHDEVFNQWFTSGPQSATKVDEPEPALVGCSEAAAQQNQQIDDETNAGAAMLSFVGHGAFRSWGRACSFFDTAPPTAPPGEEDLDDILPGAPLQFHIHANCITGNFAATSSVGSSNDSWYVFLEDWLLTEGKGAIGGIAPGHLAFQVFLDPIVDPIYAAVFDRRKERLFGVLDLEMRLALEERNARTALRSMILMGDPATTLAVPAPSKPTITAIEREGAGALRVSWSGAADAERYRIYRARSASGPYIVAGEVDAPATSFLDTGLVNCSEYFYALVSLDARGFESRWSNFNETCTSTRDPDDCKSGTPEDSDPPLPPEWVPNASERVVDLKQGGRLRVSWQKRPSSEQIKAYVVEWSTTPGGPYTGSKRVNELTDSTVIGGLENDVTHYVVVRSEHCSLLGPPGSEEVGEPHLVRGQNPPETIVDLIVEKSPDANSGALDGADDVRLSWGPVDESVWGVETNLAAYDVHASSSPPPFRADSSNLLVSLDPATTSTVHELAPSSAPEWYYLVVARDAEGLSSAAGSGFPKSVDDLRVEELDATTLRLSWGRVEGTLEEGRSLVIERYDLHGRDALLPRAEAGATTLLESVAQQAAGPLVVDRPTPAEPFYTYQVIPVDTFGTEAVW